MSRLENIFVLTVVAIGVVPAVVVAVLMPTVTSVITALIVAAAGYFGIVIARNSRANRKQNSSNQ